MLRRQALPCFWGAPGARWSHQRCACQLGRRQQRGGRPAGRQRCYSRPPGQRWHAASDPQTGWRPAERHMETMMDEGRLRNSELSWWRGPSFPMKILNETSQKYDIACKGIWLNIKNKNPCNDLRDKPHLIGIKSFNSTNGKYLFSNLSVVSSG